MPDLAFQQANRLMRAVRNFPYVSFVFTCEVSGKSIGDADAQLAAKLSAMCAEEPVRVQKERPAEMSAVDAYAKHEEAMKQMDARRRKRLGIRDDDPSGGGGGGMLDEHRPRRASARVAVKQAITASLDDETAALEAIADEAMEVDGAADGAAAADSALPGDDGANAGGRVRKSSLDASLADVDEESARVIRDMLSSDRLESAAAAPTGRGRGRKKAAAPAPAAPPQKKARKPAPAPAVLEQDDDDESRLDDGGDVEGVESGADAEAESNAVDDDVHLLDEVPQTQRQVATTPATSAGKLNLQPPGRAQPPPMDDDDDFCPPPTAPSTQRAKGSPASIRAKTSPVNGSRPAIAPSHDQHGAFSDSD